VIAGITPVRYQVILGCARSETLPRLTDSALPRRIRWRLKRSGSINSTLLNDRKNHSLRNARGRKGRLGDSISATFAPSSTLFNKVESIANQANTLDKVFQVTISGNWSVETDHREGTDVAIVHPD